ncbi:unnamed protein product [Notodromas monacha]|uniref:Cytochrome c oxidase subunit 4 n=1 Tax=Notodromas monacha TaxID=399045 RepID=A0A7R9BDJ4_9CRUS|nr:unnamed protein product [Notodromas monacha]CAG0913357.1 unnamed protein product [Notodromas monacha]
MAASLLSRSSGRVVSLGGRRHVSTTASVSSAVSKIGSREVVGHGFNGEASYMDRADYPFPAVRFREPSAEFKALLAKEKGDWKNLSVEEKKALYRFSFCQTIAELKAPTGEWKFCIGFGLFLSSFAIWIYIWMKRCVYSPMPESTTLENKQAQLRRMIDMRIDPIDGVSSRWDYENDRWKSS